jgi:hypothetical protein
MTNGICTKLRIAALVRPLSCNPLHASAPPNQSLQNGYSEMEGIIAEIVEGS